MAALLSDENWECVALRMALIDSRRLSPLISLAHCVSGLFDSDVSQNNFQQRRLYSVPPWRSFCDDSSFLTTRSNCKKVQVVYKCFRMRHADAFLIKESLL
jgi:hypothetical protein